ncbi:MobQ family relaxase [Citrobacter freundii]|uniref:MobQ family relaxase n=1 Tax=Citrobacter TaxID=544 RepID=UPI000FEB9CEE|nr:MULTISPECIES: MobQ family relaxase [Citrobacter]MDM2728332.1 MobA/MobL family protein [Citrobacter sp. Cy234]RWT75068.1 molybdopterin-guanine dinucleotide biosynthesis protein MobA [Citrobacter freundii]WOR63425.1 MobQ family relaxase [Citrobacter freundii]HDX4397061.1 MobA/MobL family protein [Citrobacter freundii]HEP1398001.1 MobA/MobL family protein [Citrobacter freundii]
MAIYSFKMENISRGEGQSSVNSAAYRHRKVFFDNRTGEVCGRKTAHKKDLAFAQIFAPEHTPPALIVDSETLWNAVEASEKRKDARLAKEFKIALPAELTPEQSIELTAAFVLEHFTKQGIIADVVIHDINGHNPHIHIMGTTREVLSTGFGKKVREWDKPEALDSWRKGWQEICNEFLELYGHDERIDHRSIRVQYEEAVEQATTAATNEEKAIWLAKAIETNRDPILHIPRDRWGTVAAQEQRAAEQAIRDELKKEAVEAYIAFKDLPLEIVVDVASFTVHALAEPEEIVIPDKTGRASSTGPQKPVLVSPVPHTRTTLKKPSSSTARANKRAPVNVKRKHVEPRQDGIFKRFTLLVVEYIKERFVWAKKKPAPVSVDTEHDKRIAENYVFDEVQGIYVPRTEYERRTRFNSDSYSPTKEEVKRFPSRPCKVAELKNELDYVPKLTYTETVSVPKLRPSLPSGQKNNI